jgi:DNA-binding FadR family transcriptional regulator
LGKLATQPSHERLASIVAGQIAKEIIKSNMPIGHLIGTEEDLMRRFEVSRDPLREAVRILEWQGMVESSRGRSGGLKVLATADYATAGMLRTYLQLSDISLTELMEAAKVFQDIILPEVVTTTSSGQIATMRHWVKVAREYRKANKTNHQSLANLRRAITAAAKNPVTQVFMEAVARSVEGFAYAGPSPRISKGRVDLNIDLLEAKVDAIERRDLSSALSVEERIRLGTFSDLLVEEGRDHSVWNTSSYLMGNYKEALAEAKGSQKGAVQLAFRIAAYIRRNDLMPGSRLDLLQVLGKRPEPSRALLREATRLLEFFGVIEVRMGKLGGAHVATPNPALVIAWTKLYFEYIGARSRHVADLRESIEQSAAQLCASRLSTTGVLQLKSAMDRLSSHVASAEVASTVYEVIRLIYVLTNSRVLSLFGDVLIELAQGKTRKIQRRPNVKLIRDRLSNCGFQLSTAFLRADTKDIAASINTLRDIANALI